MDDIAIIKDDRRKLDAILKQVRDFDGRVVKVGFLEGTPAHEGGISMAYLASIHEYGTKDGRVPERSFLRGWVAEAKEEIAKWMERTQRVIDTGGSVSSALDRLGVWAVGEVRKKIRRGPFARLKYRKGTPLIDSGQLRGSVSYGVMNKGYHKK